MSSGKKVDDNGEDWNFELEDQSVPKAAEESKKVRTRTVRERRRDPLKLEDASKLVRKSRTALAREEGPTRKIAKSDKIPANLFLRGLAFLIDLSLFGLGALGAVFAGDTLTGFTSMLMETVGMEVPIQLDLYTMVASAIFVYFVLNVVFIVLFRATIGKLLMGLRLRGYHYLDLKFSSAIAREFLFKPFAMALVVDFVLPLFNKDRRALHDYLAQTMVVKKRR